MKENGITKKSIALVILGINCDHWLGAFKEASGELTVCPGPPDQFGTCFDIETSPSDITVPQSEPPCPPGCGPGPDIICDC